jgi:DNA-binding HxlR family transcriptional regulator
VLHARYDTQVCSIARSLEVVGERWTLLIIRDLFLGLRRFDELQANLGVARNVLASRLEKLVAEGVVEKALYEERPPRHEYRLTEKGTELFPLIATMVAWGDAHAPAPDGPPTLLVHRGCGGALDAHQLCTTCGKALSAAEVQALPGPGAGEDHPLRKVQARREQRRAEAQLQQ